MLPESDLPLRVVGDEAFVDYLGVQDTPWIRVLVDELRRLSGQPHRKVVERLAGPLPCTAPVLKQRAFLRVLLRKWGYERPASVRPMQLREVLFRVAAQSTTARDRIIEETAAVFGLSINEFMRWLFADLPGERIVCTPEHEPTLAELVLHTNLAIAQGILQRASEVTLSVEGNIRPLVRLAKLRGLLCTVVDRAPGATPQLVVSGPFGLFRHTLLYGRALAGLLPHLAWCPRFLLRARCRLWGRICEVKLDRDAPVFPAEPPNPFDSKLEARLYAELGSLLRDWDIIREPEPVRAGGAIIFPDFVVRHRLFPERRVFLEIVGFWTPEYLEKKLAGLRAASLSNLLVCVDEERACATATELAGHAQVLGYKRRIDAEKVAAAIERMTGVQPTDRAWPEV